jgi:ClpP class serine protease
MTALTRKEENLIKLAIFEANELLMDQIYRDFGASTRRQTYEQQNKMQEVFEVLYTTLAEIVKENGSLQSKYDR